MVFSNPDWLGYPEYRHVDFIDPEEGNCPVCGAANGSCKGSDEFEHMINFLPKKKEDPFATFSVPERVYTEEQIGTRTIRKLLYSPGDRITVAEAQRVGLL